MPGSPPILTLRDVEYRWPGRTAFAIEVPDLTLTRGESVLLLGASGSGKTTLLSLICGTITAQSGSVSVNGTDLTALTAGKRDRFRAEEIGLIFQQFNLLPFASVRENILLPLQFAPDRRRRVPDPATEVARLCQALELPEGLITARADTLSVGQQQRVAAARALIGAPPLIVADEPTSALDAATQTAFLDLLFAQTRDHDSTLVMVSHDARLAADFDRVLRMTDIAQSTRSHPR